MNAGFLILIMLLLLVTWLLVVRPQRRRQQAQREILDNVRIGDEVITAGGLYATVTGISDDELTVELSPGTQARVAKRAIAAIVPPEEEELEEAAEEAEGAELSERTRR